jgi:hypothetical protein
MTAAAEMPGIMVDGCFLGAIYCAAALSWLN